MFDLNRADKMNALDPAMFTAVVEEPAPAERSTQPKTLYNRCLRPNNHTPGSCKEVCETASRISVFIGGNNRG
jgi:hypothetical protein